MTPRPTEAGPSECLTGVGPREAGAYANELDAAAFAVRQIVGKLQLSYWGEMHRTGNYTPPGAAAPPDGPGPLRRDRNDFWAAVRTVQRVALASPRDPHPAPDAARAARERAREILLDAFTASTDWPSLEVAVQGAAGLFVRARIAEERPTCRCHERDAEGRIVHVQGCFYLDVPRCQTAEERNQDLTALWRLTEQSRDRNRDDLYAALKVLRPLRAAAEDLRAAWERGAPSFDVLAPLIAAVVAALPKEAPARPRAVGAEGAVP